MVFYSKGVVILMRKLYIVKSTRDFDDIIKTGTNIKNKYLMWVARSCRK